MTALKIKFLLIALLNTGIANAQSLITKNELRNAYIDSVGELRVAASKIHL